MCTLRYRYFLDPDSTGYTSYILAEVESSDNGKNPYGTNLLTIADCHRSIRLEFFLGNAAARKESLRKIQLLINVLTIFRETLKKEIAAIEKQQPR